jgi:hypothetical protein
LPTAVSTNVLKGLELGETVPVLLTGAIVDLTSGSILAIAQPLQCIGNNSKRN